MKRTLTVLSALAGLLALLVSIGAMPASASESQGYVGGGGIVTNDWGDEGTLSPETPTPARPNCGSGSSGPTAPRSPDGHLFSEADVDGEFGPITAAATRNWQSRHHVDVDGIVGPETFGAADGRLHVADDAGGGDLFIVFDGSSHNISFQRDDGVYFSPVPFDPTGGFEWIRANYRPPCILNGTCS